MDKGKGVKKDMKTMDQMNRTFMANTNNKVGRLLGLNVESES